MPGICPRLVSPDLREEDSTSERVQNAFSSEKESPGPRLRVGSHAPPAPSCPCPWLGHPRLLTERLPKGSCPGLEPPGGGALPRRGPSSPAPTSPDPLPFPSPPRPSLPPSFLPSPPSFLRLTLPSLLVSQGAPMRSSPAGQRRASRGKRTMPGTRLLLSLGLLCGCTQLLAEASSWW